MPIEFRCSSCSRLLRTGDDTAGKKAKCPQCGSILTIPAVSDTDGDPTSAQSTSNPALGDLRAGVGEYASEQAPNPYAAPTAGGIDLSKPLTDESLRVGLPWEREGKSAATFWGTFKEIMASPTDAFRRMRRVGGLADPMWYGVIGGTIGTWFGLLYPSLINMARAAAGSQEAVVIMVFYGCFAVFAPLLVIVGFFINSGITHLMLMLVGGARRPFETTFRVVAYAGGATSLLCVIPCVGSLFQGILNLIYVILGLANAHEISGAKASMAVLLPLFIICGLFTLVAVAIITAAVV